MTAAQTNEHDRVFREAITLVRREIISHESQFLPNPDEALRLKLERALELFARVVKLNPNNWSAMWFIGKIYQRLRNFSAALTWFVRAHNVNPSQADVAREASLCAMSLGLTEEGVAYARSALESQPTNSGLQANLALALLLAGRLDEAKMVIRISMNTDTVDKISQKVGNIINHFIAIGKKPPTTTSALEDYWAKQRGN